MPVLLHSPALLLVSSQNDPILLAIAGVAAGVYLFYKGFRMLQRKRLIENTPTSKIRSAAMGLVEVTGLATGPCTITAPLTQYPCYFHRSMVWIYVQAGKSKEWKKVVDEGLHVPFYLEDETGRVLIDPSGAEMDIHCDYHQEYKHGLLSDDPIPANVDHFLAAHAVTREHPIKVEEYCIKPKNALFVLGTLAENPGITVSDMPVKTQPPAATTVRRSVTVVSPDELKRREQFAAAMGFHVTGAMPHPAPHPTQAAKPPAAVDAEEQHRRELFATALLGRNAQTAPLTAAAAAAGQSTAAPVSPTGGHPSATAPQVDAEEQKRRQLFMSSVFGPPVAAVAAPVTNNATPSSPASSTTGQATNFDLHPPVLLMKGGHDPAFFISWRSQRDVVAQLGWKSVLYIWGGPVLTLVCVAIVLNRFGLL